MFFLHPIALGIIGILHPSGVFMLPAGLELRSTALGQHKNAFGAENTNDPAGKGCKNLPFLLPQRANNGKREILPTPEMDETEGFQCLGHSNWTTCSPLSPFCSEIFPTFSLSYWGANSYYPRGLIMGKGKFFQLPI